MVLNIREDDDPSRRDRSEDTSHPGGSPTGPETTLPRSGMSNFPLHINGDHRHSSPQAEENGGRGSNIDSPLDFSVKRKDSSPVVKNGHRAHTNGIVKDEPRSPEERMVESSSPPLLPSHLNHIQRTSPVPNGTKTIKSEANGLLNGNADKLVDSKPVFPGFFPGGVGMPQSPGMVLPPYFNPAMMSGLGMIGAMPPLMSDPKTATTSDSQNGKGNRPFKSYPKDPISTMPMGYFGMPNGVPALPAIDVNTAQAISQNSDDMYRYYRDYVMKLQQQQKSSNKNNGQHTTMQVEDISDTESIKDPSHEDKALLSRAPQSPPCLPSQSSQSPPTQLLSTSPTEGIGKPFTSTPTSSGNETHSNGRKRSRLPDEQKDASYWERRRKNNEAAKRSRDARRAKEDEIAIRAAFLEQENLKLRVEVAALKTETAKLRCMLYNS